MFKLLLSLIGFLISIDLICQEVINGIILDSESNKTLPYASIFLQKGLKGSMSNDSGYFEIQVPDNSNNDSLVFKYLGYYDKVLPLHIFKSGSQIMLERRPIEIDSITVRPQPPIYYYKRALAKDSMLTPHNAYSTISYIRQDFYENGNRINIKEFVVKSYFPEDPRWNKNSDQLSGKDSSMMKAQHQILLFRDGGLEGDMNFMKKKIEKEKKKAIKKGEDPGPDSRTYLVDSMFGGPKTAINWLRSNTYRKSTDTSLINYKKSYVEFGKETNDEQIVIDITHKKTENKEPRSKWKYYIRSKDDAIFNSNGYVYWNLPIYIKPLLLVMGISLDYVKLEMNTNGQMIENYFYSSSMQFNFHIKATKKYLFKENERSNFLIKQRVSVSEFNIDNPQEINEKYRFDQSKYYKNQVYNDIGISWDDVNRIR